MYGRQAIHGLWSMKIIVQCFGICLRNPQTTIKALSLNSALHFPNKPVLDNTYIRLKTAGFEQIYIRLKTAGFEQIYIRLKTAGFEQIYIRLKTAGFEQIYIRIKNQLTLARFNGQWAQRQRVIVVVDIAKHDCLDHIMDRG